MLRKPSVCDQATPELKGLDYSRFAKAQFMTTGNESSLIMRSFSRSHLALASPKALFRPRRARTKYAIHHAIKLYEIHAVLVIAQAQRDAQCSRLLSLRHGDFR